jgi:aryl-alcohol dehydrogenase-like predicted oxidoreductase
MKTSLLLGNTDITISSIGLGCMGFSHAYGEPMEKNEAASRIRAAYDMGYTFFDTAQRYTGTNLDGTTSYNEEMVGEALKDIRSKVVIATKCGITMVGNERTTDARPETIKTALEESLKRLQTDYVDLYYLHTIDPNTPIEIVAQTMKELFEAGKIRAWGISQADETTMRKAHAEFKLSAVQNRYSMMATENEILFSACKELGITFVAFSPLANGFLSGAYDGKGVYDNSNDFRARMPQFTEDGYAKSGDLLNYLKKLAMEKEVTMAQVSLAWMINKDLDIVPIPGTRKPERLEENFNSCKIAITAEEVRAIDEALKKIPIGPVYKGLVKKS